MKTTIHFPKPIIKSNRPLAILPQEEYESLLETFEVLNDQKLLRRIESALSNLRKSEFFTHDEVFHSKPR
ncbi:MAG: hypothetical protein AAB019_03345 [Planctomycetota bacterium]